MATIQTMVNNGLYKSANDREFEKIEPGGNRSNVALDILQGLFDEYRQMIPYLSKTTYTTYAELTNTDYVSVSNVEYILGDVRYSLPLVSRTMFLRMASIENVSAPPQVALFDELTQTIEVYPVPLATGENFEVYGLLGLGSVELSTAIPTNMPRFMRTFLEYELARRLCEEYGIAWSDSKEQTRRDLYRRLVNSQDLSLIGEIVDPYRKRRANQHGYPWLWAISH